MRNFSNNNKSLALYNIDLYNNYILASRPVENLKRRNIYKVCGTSHQEFAQLYSHLYTASSGKFDISCFNKVARPSFGCIYTASTKCAREPQNARKIAYKLDQSTHCVDFRTYYYNVEHCYLYYCFSMSCNSSI